MTLTDAFTADHWHQWHHHDGPWFLIPVAFWILVIVLFARFRGRHHRPGGSQVLDEAFARGEITAEDYRSRLDVLREARRPTWRRR